MSQIDSYKEFLALEKKLDVLPQTWEDIIKEFKAKRKEGDGFAATLALLYLTFDEAHPYNMAKTFRKHLREENGWNKEILYH